MNDSQRLVSAVYEAWEAVKGARNGRRTLPSSEEVRLRFVALGGAKYPAKASGQKLDDLAEALKARDLPDVTSLVVTADGKVPEAVFDEDGAARIFGWSRRELPAVRKAAMEARPEDVVFALGEEAAAAPDDAQGAAG